MKRHPLGALLLCACLASCITSKDSASEASLGAQYAKDGLLKEAISSYSKALLKDPHNSAINLNLGILYVKIGDYKKAETHLNKSLSQYGNNFEANFYLGEAYRAREKLGQAIYRYNRALELKPKSIKTLKALAWSYHQVRFYAEALTTTSKLMKLSPGDHQTTIIAARTLLKLGRHKKALATIQQGELLAKQGELPYLQSVEGDIYFKTGDFAKAEATYREALKDQPLLAGALLGLAKCIIHSKKDLKLAIEYMERAVRIKPKLPEGLYLLGKYYETIDPDKSQKYYKSFRHVAATDPEFQDELLEIGKLPARAAQETAKTEPPKTDIPKNDAPKNDASKNELPKSL